MEMSKYEKYKTLDSLPIVTKVWLPDATAVRRGVIQFVHGMCEMKERYNHVIKYFTDRGYICVISDLRGHGENVLFEKDFGYFGDDGANLLVEDVHAVTIFIKNNYPDLPITLMGHSMGSLIARALAKKYDGDIDMLVLLGSPSMHKLRSLGVHIVSLWSVFRDDHEVDKFIDKLIMGQYSKKYAHEAVPNSWICSDMKVVEAYNEDSRCGFTFTINGYKALCQLQTMVYSTRNWAMNNRRLKIMYLSGEDDPYLIDKETFEKSVNVMRKVGYKNISTKLYEGKRHEILNESGYLEICEEILKNLPVE